jgi:hypothetical protein
LDELRLGDEFYRHALYLLVKLAANSNILPTSLFVHGVDIGSIRDPIYGGGFADIYQGRFEGIDVAVKKLRLNDGTDRAKIHSVSASYVIAINTPQLPTVFLPGSSCMETTQSSQRPTLHRCGCRNLCVDRLFVHDIPMDGERYIGSIYSHGFICPGARL